MFARGLAYLSTAKRQVMKMLTAKRRQGERMRESFCFIVSRKSQQLTDLYFLEKASRIERRGKLQQQT